MAFELTGIRLTMWSAEPSGISARVFYDGRLYAEVFEHLRGEVIIYLPRPLAILEWTKLHTEVTTHSPAGSVEFLVQEMSATREKLLRVIMGLDARASVTNSGASSNEKS